MKTDYVKNVVQFQNITQTRATNLQFCPGLYLSSCPCPSPTYQYFPVFKEERDIIETLILASSLQYRRNASSGRRTGSQENFCHQVSRMNKFVI